MTYCVHSATNIQSFDQLHYFLFEKNLWHSPFQNKRGGGVRSTLLWALGGQQLGNIGRRDTSQWALKESLRRTMYRSKNLPNYSPCWQHYGRMLPRAKHVTRPSIIQCNKTITCNAASKRKAQSEGPRHEARAERLREKIVSGPLISTLEWIMQLYFKIWRISEYPRITEIVYL